jgi:hypothetical protein
MHLHLTTEDRIYLNEVADRKVRPTSRQTERHTGPVWRLVEARNLGVPEAPFLIDYPRLKAANLVDARTYAEDHPEEIATHIQQHEVAWPVASS